MGRGTARSIDLLIQSQVTRFLVLSIRFRSRIFEQA